jgi:hypothetical protein
MDVGVVDHEDVVKTASANHHHYLPNESQWIQATIFSFVVQNGV